MKVFGGVLGRWRPRPLLGQEGVRAHLTAKAIRSLHPALLRLVFT